MELLNTDNCHGNTFITFRLFRQPFSSAEAGCFNCNDFGVWKWEHPQLQVAQGEGKLPAGPALLTLDLCAKMAHCLWARSGGVKVHFEVQELCVTPP